MRIHLDNLFNGNKVLSASFSMFLNQNSKEILNELQDDLENGLGDIFMGIWNSVYHKMPIKYWLIWKAFEMDLNVVSVNILIVNLE